MLGVPRPWPRHRVGPAGWELYVGKTTMVKQVVEKVMSHGLFHHVVMAIVSQTESRKNLEFHCRRSRAPIEKEG